MTQGAVILRFIKNIKQQCLGSDGNLINSNFDFDATDIDQLLVCNEDGSQIGGAE